MSDILFFSSFAKGKKQTQTLHGKECVIYTRVSSKEQAETDFLIRDEVSTSRSSWINGASFSSCDGKIGFLIVQIGNRNYVHQNVPIAIWKNFKTSSSFGNFYNQNLKNKYRLKLRRS